MISVEKDNKIWRECSHCSSRKVFKIDIKSEEIQSSTSFFLCEECVKKLMFELDMNIESQY